VAEKPKAKPKPKPKAEKPQRERFIEAARELGVDETGAEFERLFAKIVPPKRPVPRGAAPAPAKHRKT
jgi:hypothetical protein